MSDLERNKQISIEFYTLAFNDKQPAEAVRQYVGSQYIQHNPLAGDGPEAFIQFVEGFGAQYPQLSVEIKRTIAEGDLVAAHCLLKLSPDDRGTAVMDIFRLQDGKVVEHWDVLQPIPETSANTCCGYYAHPPLFQEWICKVAVTGAVNPVRIASDGMPAATAALALDGDVVEFGITDGLDGGAPAREPFPATARAGSGTTGG